MCNIPKKPCTGQRIKKTCGNLISNSLCRSWSKLLGWSLQDRRITQFANYWLVMQDRLKQFYTKEKGSP